MKKLLILGLSLALAGCATSARKDNMAVNPANLTFDNAKFEQNIYIGEVTGGQRIHPLLAFRVENENFRDALAASLASQNLLCEEKAKCLYQLNSEIESFHIPAFTIDAKVTSKVNYQLINTTTNEQEKHAITGYFVAEWTKSLYAPNRPLIGAEGSVKENIKLLLQRLNQSTL